MRDDITACMVNRVNRESPHSIAQMTRRTPINASVGSSESGKSSGSSPLSFRAARVADDKEDCAAAVVALPSPTRTRLDSSYPSKWKVQQHCGR